MTTSKSGRIGGTRIPTIAHFSARRTELSQLRIETLQGKIRQCRNAISAGNYKVIFEILEIVVARDFDPRLMQTAKDALALIRDINTDNITYKDFGFSSRRNPNYFLGAFYELLPQDLAVKLFAQQYIREYFYRTDYVDAGQIFLRMSSPEKALEFAQALPKGAARLLLFLKKRPLKAIRTYSYRNFNPARFLKHLPG